MNPLKDALEKRKGKGLAVEIAVGKPEGEAEPAAPAEAHQDEEMSKLEKLASLVKDNPEASALVAELMSGEQVENEQEMAEGESADKEMMGDMSDADKAELSARGAPRSLGERAKMAALERMKK